MTLDQGRAAKVKLVTGPVLEGRCVKFGDWLHFEGDVSRGVREREDGDAERIEETARRSWPREAVAEVEWL